MINNDVQPGGTPRAALPTLESAPPDKESQAKRLLASRLAERQAETRRLSRQRNRRLQELQSRLASQQTLLMQAQGAAYDSPAQRNIALIRARAGMLAAHVALSLATNPPTSVLKVDTRA